MESKSCEGISHVWLLVIPTTVACQAPLSIKFSRQEYLSGLPFPSPKDLPDSEIKGIYEGIRTNFPSIIIQIPLYNVQTTDPQQELCSWMVLMIWVGWTNLLPFNGIKRSITRKPQNSGLPSKEEKPRDPINQPSRCNTQEGLLSIAQTGWLWSPGRQSTPNSKLGELFICKKTILSAYYIRVTKWLVTRLQSNPIGTNFAGYMFTKQSYWHKFRGLSFKLKAILLVQTARAFVQT